MSSVDRRKAFQRLRNLISTSSFRQAAAIATIFLIVATGLMLWSHHAIMGILETHVCDLIERDIEAQVAATHLESADAMA